MQFTSPDQVRTHAEPFDDHETLRALRLDLAAELDAINLYQSHIEAISDPHVQAVLARIRDDEKEHVAQLMSVLHIIDVEQGNKCEDARVMLEPPAQKLLYHPNIAERIASLDRRVTEFSKRLGE